MKKINIATILISLTLISLFNISFAAERVPTINLYIEDQQMTDKEMGEAIIINSRTLVPVRLISEKYGYNVKWDEKTQTVDISSKEKKLEIGIGKITAKINGETENVPGGVPAIIYDSRTYVPLKFVSNAFGLNVVYDSKGPSVKVNKTKEIFVEDDKYPYKSPAKFESKTTENSTSNTNEIIITKNPFAEHKVFTLDSPKRIVIDIFDTDMTKDSLKDEIFNTSFEKIDSCYHDDLNKLRIVLYLKHDISLYEINERMADEISIFIDNRNIGSVVDVPKVDVPKVDSPSVNPENPFNDIYIPSSGQSGVVLDAGHGGHDSGAKGLSGVYEKNMNLIMTEKIYKNLLDSNVKVITTRSTDEFIELKNRAQVAKDNNAALFISVHFNAASSSQASGIEILYKDVLNNKELSRRMQEALISATGAKDRGIVNRENLAVLNGSGTSFPAMLLELGFVSNQSDVDKMLNEQYQDLMAKTISDMIIEFLEN